MNKTFSIVVPFFNEADKIRHVATALLAIDWPANDFEIIFSDNLSTDDSVSIIESVFKGRSHYKIVTSDARRSSYAARNTGWNAANGRYIVFIDADCIVDVGILKGYMESIRSLGIVDIVAGKVVGYDSEESSLIERYSIDKKMLNQESAVSGWAYRPFAQTANAMFSRSILEKNNGFNEFMTSGGDGEICWRTIDLFNVKIHYCESAIVRHWHRNSLRSLFAQFEKYGEGRYQQNAVIKSFKGGLLGANKSDYIKLLESFEALILKKINDTNIKKDILWSFYDVVSRCANIFGYLVKKSGLASLSEDPFSTPRFTCQCNVCGGLNFDVTPGFSKSPAVIKPSDNCFTCTASVFSRLMCELSSVGILEDKDYICEDFSNFLKSRDYSNQKIIFTETVSSHGEYINIIEKIKYSSSTFLLLSEVEPYSASSIFKYKGLHASMRYGICGMYSDKYTGKMFSFSLVKR